jgi:uncharacterized membrane protein YkoI
MVARRLAGLLILSGLSIIPMSALAREATDATKPALAQPQSELDRAEIFQEIKAFSNVRISLRDAITIAEKRAVGSKVVDVSFDGLSDRLAYRVKTYHRDKISECTIDASTGEIIGAEIEAPVATLDFKDKVELAGFRAAGIDLFDVVPIAEQYASGKAVSAGLETEDGKLTFLVVVVTDGSLEEISVRPNEAKSQIRKASVRRKH